MAEATIVGDLRIDATPKRGYLPGQERARQLLEDPNGPTWVLLSGGMGAGKTHFVACELVRLMLINLRWALANGYRIGDVNGLLLAPTYGLLKKSSGPKLSSVLEEFGMAGRYRWNKSDGILRLDFGGGFDDAQCSKIFTYTAERPELIIGSDVSAAAIDEPGTPKEGEALHRCAGRLRGPGLLRKVVMGGTPEDIVSREWFYELIASPNAQRKYGEKGDNSRRIVFAATRENVFIPNRDQYVKGMLAVFTKQQALAYEGGQFVAFNAARVYSAFIDRSVEHGGHTIPDQALDEATGAWVEHPGLARPGRGSILFLGLDFNVDPMCGVVAFRHGDGGLRVIDEIRIPNAGDEEGKTPITRWCEEAVRRWVGTWEGPVAVGGDATEKKQTVAASMTGWAMLHDHLERVVRERGWDYHRLVWGSNPREIDRVNTVNAAFEHGKILVAERCTYLRKDLNLVAWKPGTTEVDKSEKDLTHLSDGLGYLVIQDSGYVAGRGAMEAAQIAVVAEPSIGETWDWGDGRVSRTIFD